VTVGEEPTGWGFWARCFEFFELGYVWLEWRNELVQKKRTKVVGLWFWGLAGSWPAVNREVAIPTGQGGKEVGFCFIFAI
jgi:hypothetical protein